MAPPVHAQQLSGVLFLFVCQWQKGPSQSQLPVAVPEVLKNWPSLPPTPPPGGAPVMYSEGVMEAPAPE